MASGQASSKPELGAQAIRGDLPTTAVVEAFFQGTDTIRHFAESVMLPVLRGQLSQSDREVAISGSYYRMIAWVKTVSELGAEAHYQAVASGARSMFESLLDIKILHSDRTGQMVDRFHAFPEIEKYRAAKRVVSYCDSARNTTIACTSQREFIERMEMNDYISHLATKYWGLNAKGKPIFPSHWSGMKVEERAKHCGVATMELYIEFYPYLSWHIHSGSTGYSGLSPSTFESGFGLMHGLIQNMFLEATEVCAEEMKLDKGVGGMKSSIEGLRKTTEKILESKYTGSAGK